MWLPVMVVLLLVFAAQLPLKVQAYQDGAAPTGKVDWLQFGFTPAKTANNTAESTITTGSVSQLTPLFSVPLPAADNSDGAPVLLTNVSTASGVRDLIFTLGEHGHLTAFDANTGAIVWAKVFAGGGSNNVAPILDLNRMFVYAVTPDGMVHKLNVGDGSEVTTGGWPKSLGSGKSGGEPTIATARNGHTYLYALHHGHGHVVTFDLTDGTQHVFNLACSQFPDVLDPAGCTERGANPWSRNNPYDASLDRFFVGTGTNDGTHWVAGSIWRQSWVALPADGSTQMMSGGGFPADNYTPTDWQASVSADRDICPGGLAILPVGLSSKFPHLAVNPGKDAKIRLINLADMSGHGGPGHLGGEIQLLSFSTGSLMRAASAVWTNPADGAVWVFITGNSGLHGFTVDVDAAGNPSLHSRWNLNNGWTTSAVVANGVLFAAVGGGEHSSTTATHKLQAVNPTTGAVLWTGTLGAFHWASPIVANGTVYMADGNSGGFGGNAGVLRAWRAPIEDFFTLSASPASQSIAPGAVANYNVNVASTGGFNGSVTLGVSGLPAGATSSLSVNPINGGSGSSMLTVSTSGSTPSGTYTLTITGTSGAISHSVSVTLVVAQPDFAISVMPNTVTVSPGGCVTPTVTITATGGFSGAVALSVSGLPIGWTATFNPSSVAGSGTATLNLCIPSSTPPGTYTITITGSSGGLSHSVILTVVVTVPPVCVTATNGHGWVNTPFAAQTGTFTAQFDVMPSSTTIGGHVGLSHGAQTAYTGFANIVRFSTTGIIDARDGSGYSGPTTPVHYSADVMYHVRLVSNLTTHRYAVFVTPPKSMELTIGGDLAFRTEQSTVTTLDNWGAFVAATTTNSLEVCNFTVASGVVPSSGTAAPAKASMENVSSAGAVATTGQAAAATFSLTPSPATQTVNAGGGSASFDVNVAVTGGENGTMYPAGAIPPNVLAGRAVSINCADCPVGKKVAQLLGHAPQGRGTLQFNSISVPADGNYDVTWGYYCGKSDNNGDTTCGGQPHTPSGCRPGIFVINGVQLPTVHQFQCFPGTWHELHSATFSVPLKAGMNSLKIFSNSADCPDVDRIVVADGTGGTSNEAVTLSLSGLPSGATAAFSPTAVIGSAHSTLTITTTAALAKGSYPFTISGNSGTETETTSATLVVGSGGGGGDFSIAVSPTTQHVLPGGSTTYTATVTASGGFSGTAGLSIADLPAGASGSFNPSTITGSGSSTLTITTSAVTPTGSFPFTVTGTSGAMTHAATATLVVDVPPACVTATNGHGWVNTSFTPQAGTFTAQFDVIPSSARIGGHVALSNGPQNAFTGFANIVRFSNAGVIEARNGGIYTGAMPPFHYAAGATYHVRLVSNLATHHYGVFVTTPEGLQVTIGSNLAFRTEQNRVTTLNNFGAFVAATTANSLQVCNFTVQ
jgi:uncharacterized membrane protein